MVCLSRTTTIRLACLSLGLAGLSACADEAAQDIAPETDPIVQRALNDPLMIEPDLASQNLGNSALEFDIGHPLPPENDGPAAVLAAREEAFAVLGGSSGLKDLPASGSEVELAEAEAFDTVGRLDRLSISKSCEAQLRFSGTWVARLPERLQPFPRGSTKEAIGSATGNCRAVAALYLTPVPIEDVLRYHFSRLDEGGARASYTKGETWHSLTGSIDGGRYEITARELPSGLAEVGIAYLGAA